MRNLRALAFCAGDYQSTFKGSQISCLTFPLPLLPHPLLKKQKGVKLSSTRLNEPHCPGKWEAKTLASWRLFAGSSEAGSSSLVPGTVIQGQRQLITTGTQIYFPNLLTLHHYQTQRAATNKSIRVLGERMWFCNSLFSFSLCGPHLALKEQKLREVRITHIGLILTPHPALSVTWTVIN